MTIRHTKKAQDQNHSHDVLGLSEAKGKDINMNTQFIAQCFKAASDSIINFIIDFQGGIGDEEDFDELMRNVNCNKIYLPVNIQDIVDGFIKKYLEPMVFEPETVFVKKQTLGYVDEDGCHHIDDEREVVTLLVEFMQVKMETQDAWMSTVTHRILPLLFEER